MSAAEFIQSHWVAVISAVFYTAGFVCAGFSLWRSRTPQGATAWVVGLLSFPFLVVPLFLVFGRSKFHGYARERKELDHAAQAEMADAQAIESTAIEAPNELRAVGMLAKLSKQPGFTRSNEISLLIDGEETYVAMLDAIARAQKYVLLQCYVFRVDKVGRRFADELKAKARQGVRVHFMYDEVGGELDAKFVRELEEVGISVGAFRGIGGSLGTRFQLNFRNHRKIVVVDGHTAFVGGLNVGDDYLGRWKSIGPWRDTHARIRGPSALAAQLSFVKDWYWVTEKMPDLDWEPQEVAGGSAVLTLPTGPADEGEVCLLAHLALVNSARKRLWIANPYFVPPEGLRNALEAAALRGVDVRILVPSKSDNKLVDWASSVFQHEIMKAGVRIHAYLPGFLHQKVLLVDDQAALVGSANLDSRSMFINFEIFAVTPDPVFVASVAKMLETDFANSREVTIEEHERKRFPRQLIERAVSLFAPML